MCSVTLKAAKRTGGRDGEYSWISKKFINQIKARGETRPLQQIYWFKKNLIELEAIIKWLDQQSSYKLTIQLTSYVQFNTSHTHKHTTHTHAHPHVHT